MKKAIGIILAGGEKSQLKELCKIRATAALPIASSYRAIDFSLSNMSNSNIKKVAVITQFNSRSLQDHISSAKWWDLSRKEGGLYIFSPFKSNDSNDWFRGVADSIYQNISYLKRSHEDYVVIASGDGIYKMDYQKVLDFHIKKNADITIVSKDESNNPNRNTRDFGVLSYDDDFKITNFEEKQTDAKGANISLGIYVISRELLINLLEDGIPKGYFDFVKDIILKNKHLLNLYTYTFSGYWNTLNTIDAYMQTNMDFLDKGVRSILSIDPYIYTKPSDDPPAKFNFTSQVKNSIIGTGSIIDGSVYNSILFRKVRVAKNATVNNSIIMKSCIIGKNCIIENAILDKDVIIGDNESIIGSKEAPCIISKGSVIGSISC